METPDPVPVTVITAFEYVAFNGFETIHTPDHDEAVRYARDGNGCGYVELVETATTQIVTEIFRDNFS